MTATDGTQGAGIADQDVAGAGEFLGAGWRAAVLARLAAWPDDEARRDPRKAESYWSYVARKRAAFEGAFGLGVRDVPGHDGQTAYVVVHFSGGDCLAVELGDAARIDENVTLALACDYADWVAIVDGYDIGRAMTYHRLPIVVGTALDLLKVVYFIHEVLGVMAGVPATYRSPAVAAGR